MTKQSHGFLTAEQSLDRAKAFSVPPPTLPVRRLWVQKELRRDRAGTADPDCPRGYPTSYGITPSTEHWGTRRKGGTFKVLVFVLSSKVWWSPAILGWLNTCLPKGIDEWILQFALLVYDAFALPVKLSLSQPTIFLTFSLLTLFPIPLGKTEWVDVGLCCQLELNHNTVTKKISLGKQVHEIPDGIEKGKMQLSQSHRKGPDTVIYSHLGSYFQTSLCSSTQFVSPRKPRHAAEQLLCQHRTERQRSFQEVEDEI